MIRLLGWVRCRFCGDLQRGKAAADCRRLNGVCGGCLDETLTWLSTLGGVVTLPRGVRL